MLDQTRLARFREMRDAIKGELSWRSAGPVRDAVALAALDLDGPPATVAARLKDPATVLKANHARLVLLREPVRYAIAAILLRAGIDPLLFAQTMASGRRSWKDMGLRRESPYEGAALMILQLGKTGGTDPAFLHALKTAFDDLNKRRWWQVGAAILPALALVLQYRDDAASAADAMYGAMKEEKGLHGRQTMEAALMALLSDGPDGKTTHDIAALRGALKARKIADAPARIAGLALANLTRPDPADFADDVAEAAAALKRGWWDSSAAGFALDYVTAERFAGSDDPIARLMPLWMAVQAYQLVAQQQAAATVAITGGAVAAAGS